MTVFSETNTVQGWLVEQLVGLGWDYTPGHALPRDLTDVVCEDWLVDALVRLNPEIAENPERVEEALPLIRAAILSASNDGLLAANERMTTLLRGDHTIAYVGSDGKYTPLRVIDFDNLENNRFTVTGPLPGATNPVADEVTFGAPGHARRFDTVLWVNGIPLVVIETKTPVKASVSWLNGARDITDTYEVEKAPFFAPNVLVAATEGREFHYGAVGQKPGSWLMWGSTQDPYDMDGFPRVQRSIELLLTPHRVLSILRDFTRACRRHARTHLALSGNRQIFVDGVCRVEAPQRRQGRWTHGCGCVGPPGFD